MKKRILMLLAAALLLCPLFARAEEELYTKIENALYRLVLRTEEGDVPVGSGVLFMDKEVLITVRGSCPEGELYALGLDGEHRIQSLTYMGDSAVVLAELETPSAFEPLTLARDDATGLACLFGVNDKGESSIAPLYRVRQGMYGAEEALLVSSSEGLLPGSFMTDSQGELIGLTVAQQTEGVGVYIALDANTLYRVIARQQFAGAFLPLTMTWEGGNLILAWEDEARSSGMYLTTISAGENLYYTFFEAPYTEQSIQLQLPPGHSYYLQVQWVESAADALEPVWAAMDPITLPEGKFTGYGYQQECALVTKPAGQSSAHTQNVDTPTRSLLTDPALKRYLRVSASYDVAEEIELPMAIELIAPDGQFYFESAICTLKPDKETGDTYLLPLDDLLKDCSEFSDGFQSGQYLVRYSLEGRIAGEYAFTLTDHEQEEETSREPALSGFAAGLNAHYGDGLITLHWDGESIPEGADVHVFFLYDDNPYYTYQHVEQGVTTSEIYIVPGRQTMAWVVWSTGDDSEFPTPETSMDYILVPAEPQEPLTLNGFTNVRLEVTASSDPRAELSTEFLPAVALTREVLSDRNTSIYFQTEDTYQVTETSGDLPMVIVLETPEGMCFAAPALYIFDVNLQQSDLWVMNITALFEDYEAMAPDAWPAGEYRILYCINGQVAGEYSFELE